MVRGAFTGVIAATFLSAAFSAIAQQPPAEGTWTLEPAARNAGYRLEPRREGATPCAVILPPLKSQSSPMQGSMEQTLNAKPYRGRTVRFSAWIRVNPTGLADSAQLWLRVNRPTRTEQPMGLFDNLTDSRVNSAEWTRSDATLYVDPDAETIVLGVLSAGAGTVWAKDMLLLVTDSLPNRAMALEPVNPRFTESPAGTLPQGWKVLPEGDAAHKPFKAGVTAKGCRFGGACAALESPASAPPETFGTLLQEFNAARYRGRTVRLHATLRLQHAGKENFARLWLRPGGAGEPLNAQNLSQHLDYREVRSSDWTGLEIVRKIDEDIEEIAIGVMLTGKGRVTIDDLSFGIVADAVSKSSVITMRTPDVAEPPVAAAPIMSPGSGNTALAVTLPETTWPRLPGPSIEEQREIINKASARAVTYIKDLPNFLCNLIIDRSENRQESGWKGRDVLSLQLGFADMRERYRLTTINGRPTNVPYRSVGGAISEGDFGGVMAQIFWPHTAQFHWDHWTNLRGRMTHVFRYEVEQKKSTYELQFGAKRGPPLSTISAHHGYVFIENGTNYVLRIEQIADPPAGFPLRSAGTAIDYEWSDVGGKKFLLPLREEITMGSPTLRSLNVVQFRDYRKFAAESEITFGEPDPPEQTGPKVYRH